jgi:hypothetical protein
LTPLRTPRELVGKGDGEQVMMQPLLGGLDPRPEPMALPSGRFHFYKNERTRERADIDGTAIFYVDLIPSSLALFGRLCAVATPLRVGMF